MTKELEQEAEQYSYDVPIYQVEQQLEKIQKAYLAGAEPREKRIAELESQIEKLIDFVLSKTDCCDVCPITDTCINSEGTCPYARMLANGEKELTREWLMQFISRR